MPRITLLKKRYNERDLIDWVYTKKRQKKITLDALAKALGLTRQGLYKKLQEGQNPFTYPELMELFKRLEATDEEILRMMKI